MSEKSESQESVIPDFERPVDKWRAIKKAWKEKRFTVVTHLTEDELNRLYAYMAETRAPQYQALAALVGVGLVAWETRPKPLEEPY